ncbi:MAG TPA: hypothetical protein VM511_01500, partial [Luteolibacter sp.]|nr:hypothetical protein [Luteolibacter sp.]
DAKRNKRRRRKGKGNKNGPREISDAPVGGEDAPSIPVLIEETEAGSAASNEPAAPAPKPQQQHHQQHQPRPQQQQQQRTPVDPELLAKKAWKIFLAEVSEEGVSLISDHDARELSRRCFRLAEIFLDEQGRRVK